MKHEKIGISGIRNEKQEKKAPEWIDSRERSRQGEDGPRRPFKTRALGLLSRFSLRPRGLVRQQIVDYVHKYKTV